LFGQQPERKVHLAEDIWSEKGRLNREDNVELCRPFTEEEVHRVLRELKVSSALGPDGFIYMFYNRTVRLMVSAADKPADAIFVRENTVTWLICSSSE